MQIGGIKNINQAYGIQSQGAMPIKKMDKKDEINLSTQAQDFQHAYKLAKQTPDIRSAKVEAIKERIQSGNYSIDAKEVSEKIMSRIDVKG